MLGFDHFKSALPQCIANHLPHGHRIVDDHYLSHPAVPSDICIAYSPRCEQKQFHIFCRSFHTSISGNTAFIASILFSRAIFSNLACAALISC
jgi:hypothetical protein